jgi:hypothetical protein
VQVFSQGNLNEGQVQTLDPYAEAAIDNSLLKIQSRKAAKKKKIGAGGLQKNYRTYQGSDMDVNRQTQGTNHESISSHYTKY